MTSLLILLCCSGNKHGFSSVWGSVAWQLFQKDVSRKDWRQHRCVEVRVHV